jgi:lauroyl/myristoyl acyltransferase
MDRMTIALASVRGRLLWFDPAARERSKRAIEAIVGPGPARNALARAHLAHAYTREKFIRRPSMVRGTPADGIDHLRAACAAGRGVLVSYCHLGPFPGVAVTVAEHASNVHQVAGMWLASPPPGEPQGPRWHQWRSMFVRAGVPLIPAEGCFPIVTQLVAGGAVVVMAFDWPGSAETQFLGRPAWLASGTARLAEQTGALVVPAMRQFRHFRAHTAFGPPLDPRQHAGWRALHDALAARHERWILECPEALEDPRRAGAWEAAATAEQWGAPGARKVPAAT